MTKRRIASFALAAVTTFGAATAAPEVKRAADIAHLPPAHRLKADKTDVLGSIVQGGTVKYAYRTSTRVRNEPGEIVAARTSKARVYRTERPGVLRAEIVAGEPQYFEDEQGNWWEADYATTTPEAFDLQTRRSFLERIFASIANADTGTFFPNPNPESTSVDGTVTMDNGNYAVAHNATNGSGVQDSGTEIDAGNNFNGSIYRIIRGFVLVDTSSLGAGATVISATLSLYPAYTPDNNDSDSLGVYSSNPASNTALSTDDFEQVGSTLYITSVPFGSISTGAYLGLPLNATGVAAISTTGVTKFGLRTTRDVGNNTPTGNNQAGFYSADQTGTSQDPKLVITYTPGASAAEDPNTQADVIAM